MSILLSCILLAKLVEKHHMALYVKMARYDPRAVRNPLGSKHTPYDSIFEKRSLRRCIHRWQKRNL